MFDNINKSKIEFETYLKLKNETLTKSYTERFKWVDRFLYWFAWFGNGVSIFLAFFFMQALFFSSFMDVKDSIFVTIGIVFFLTMFELLKRYVFAMFSIEAIKNKFNIFKSNMVSFILGVVFLVAGSFYLSLNGAKKFVDNRQVFKTQTETTINTRTDSLNNFYFVNYIKPLMDDNKILTDQNTDYSQQASQTTLKTKFLNQIDANNKKIESNKTQIAQYETRRDNEVKKVSDTQSTKLSETLASNKSNIIAFIILSTLVELIIMLGIYYDKFYDYKIIEEYEKTIIDTPGFKKWYKFNFLLKLIYSKTKEIGAQIPSTNGIIELSDVGGSKIDKSTLDKFIKIIYYLEIVKLEGNRRVLNMSEEDGLKKLRDYFEIK
jgi:hypothetical protein